MKIHDIKVVAALVITGLLLILPGCGDNDDDDDEFVCSQNGNISLNPSSLSFSAIQGENTPIIKIVTVDFPNGIVPDGGNVNLLWVGPPDGTTLPSWTELDPALLAVPPPLLTDPMPIGIHVTDTGSNGTSPGTYTATYRFLVEDINGALLGCQDMAVTYTLN